MVSETPSRRDLWFVAQEGRRHGRGEHDEILARLNAGDISRQAVVWRSGWVDWQPILDHFAEPSAMESRVTSARLPTPRLLWLSASLVLFLLVAAFALSLDLPLVRRLVATGMANLPRELALFDLGGTLLAAVLWGWLARTHSRPPAVSGGWELVKVLCIMAQILILPFLMFHAFMVFTTERPYVPLDALRRHQANLGEIARRFGEAPESSAVALYARLTLPNPR